MTGPQTALVPAEERGTTTLADVVVEQIAAAAAAEVRAAHGLRRHLVGKAVGRPAVRADVDLDGSVASLRLDLAVEYPAPVRPVTRDVRTHVTARVRELCDVTVDHIDITVAALPRPTTTVRRVRVPRGRRGTAASLVALVGLVICAAGAVEAVSLAVNDTTYGYEPSVVSDFLSSTTLGGTVALVVAIVLLVLGVLMLLAGIVPPKRRLVELDGDEKSVSTGLTRRSLRRTLRGAAERVDGIGSAPVDVKRRKVVVKASTSLRRTDGLADRVQAAVGSRLDDLQPRRSRSVRVRLDRKDA